MRFNEKPRELKIQLGKYSITSVIGKGSFSIVKKAIDKQGNLYAVKIYETFTQKHTNYVTEIAALQLLNHPNIVKFKDVIDKEYKVYLIMEYAGDVSLNFYIRNKKVLKEDETNKLVSKIVNALFHCHSKGVIHRDLKNENIMIDKNEPILIDFGFSKFYDGEKLTDFCGTPRYMSPEILSKQSFDGFKSDCWALGIIIFYIASGKFPFFGIDEKSLYKSIKTMDIPQDYSKNIEMVKIIQHLLKRDPLERSDIKEINDIISNLNCK